MPRILEGIVGDTSPTRKKEAKCVLFSTERKTERMITDHVPIVGRKKTSNNNT